MRTIELKTNIMCGSCIAKVTPALNETVGQGNWKVDTQNLKKVLSVATEGIDIEDVMKAVAKAGCKAEKLS